MSYPLVVNDAGVIEPQPIDPAEKFVNADDSGLSETSILDYWVWAFSVYRVFDVRSSAPRCSDQIYELPAASGGSAKLTEANLCGCHKSVKS